MGRRVMSVAQVNYKSIMLLLYYMNQVTNERVCIGATIEPNGCYLQLHRLHHMVPFQ